MEKKQSTGHEADASMPEKIDLEAMLRDAFKHVAKTWFLFLLLVILFGTAGYLKAKYTYHPQYKASASFVISSGDGSTSLLANNYYNKITTEQLSSTFPYILTSGALRRIVAEELGMSGLPGSITANMLGETNLFQISVTTDDPQMSYNILQSVVANYPKVARYIIGNTTLTLLEDIGVPQKPVNQIDYRNTILKMLFIAAAIYLAILAFLVLTRKTIRSRQELNKYLSMTYLGAVPQIRFKRRNKKQARYLLVDQPGVPSDFTESIEALTNHVRNKAKKHGWKVFLTTSAMAGEGKTTNACNLALMLSRQGKRVLLIDGDLRNPSVMEHFPIEREEETGLVDCLQNLKQAEERLIPYGEDNLQILPGGIPTSKTSKLWANGSFKKIIASYRDQFDFIIIDTPPCTFMNDTALELPLVDAAILVIRHDYAPIYRITNAVEIITGTDKPIAGYILNGDAKTSYVYGYGHYGRYGSYGRYGAYGAYGSSEINQ